MDFTSCSLLKICKKQASCTCFEASRSLYNLLNIKNVGGIAVPQDMVAAFEQASDEAGVRLRRPDKKNEKAAVAAVRASLLAGLAGEQDPAAVLAQVVPLMFTKATGVSSRILKLNSVKVRTSGCGRVTQDMES